MQPTLYNNSLWGEDWTEALCDLPFQSANASSLKRWSFITEGMLSLLHAGLEPSPSPAEGPSLLPSPAGCCREPTAGVGGHRGAEWGLQVEFSSSCCLPSEPRDAISFALRFLLIPLLLHLAVPVREWNDLSKGLELICQPGSPSCIPDFRGYFTAVRDQRFPHPVWATAN